MDRRQTDSGADTPGLMSSLAGMAKNLFGLAVNRIELAALELGEARDNLMRLLLIGAIGVIALGFAVACWTALLVVLTWDTWGWKSLLMVAAVYSLLALGVLLYARSMLRQGSLSLSATMAELRNDRDTLL